MTASRKPTASGAKAYSYRRFSSAEQSEGDSLRRQTAAAETYAKAHGLTLDRELTFSDLGVSGYRGRNVAEGGALAAFLVAVQDGIVPQGSCLLVENLDRLSRQTARKAVRVLEDLVDAGVTVVTLSDAQRYDRARLDEDPMAFMYAVIGFMRAHDESRMKASRLSASWLGKRQRAPEGKPMTATAPLWLRLDVPTGCRPDQGVWHVIPERAAVVRRIYELAAAGQGSGSIAAQLNAEGVPVFGRSKGGWYISSVRNILHSPAPAGGLVPHQLIHQQSGDAKGRLQRIPQGDVIEGYYPAVVEPELVAAVRALQQGRAPARGAAARREAASMLAGLAACPHCGGAMARLSVGSPNSKRRASRGGHPTYQCSAARRGAGCTARRRVQVRVVEQALLEGLPRAIAEAELASDAMVDVAGIEAELAGVEDHLERALEALLTLPGSLALAAKVQAAEQERARLMAERDAAMKAAAAVEPASVERRRAQLLAAFSSECSTAERNRLLRGSASKVVVNWPEGTLDVHWIADGVSSIVYAWPDGS